MGDEIRAAHDTGIMLGQIMKYIEDRWESGKVFLPMDMLRAHPQQWMRNNLFYINRYSLPADKIAAAVEAASRIIASNDDDAIIAYRAALFIGYVAILKTGGIKYGAS